MKAEALLDAQADKLADVAAHTSRETVTEVKAKELVDSGQQR